MTRVCVKRRRRRWVGNLAPAPGLAWWLDSWSSTDGANSSLTVSAGAEYSAGVMVYLVFNV